MKIGRCIANYQTIKGRATNKGNLKMRRKEGKDREERQTDRQTETDRCGRTKGKGRQYKNVGERGR